MSIPVFSNPRSSFCILMAMTLAGLCTVLLVSLWIASCVSVNPNSPYYSTRVGDFVVTVISDGTSNLLPLEQIAFQAPAPAVDLLKDANGIGDVFTMHFNPLHVDTGAHKIIIDPGSADKFGVNVGKLLSNMEKAGLDPLEVDTVLITHAHVDHIAGVRKPDGSRAFPNALYYVGRAEYEFWRDSGLEDDLFKTYRVQDTLKPLILNAAKSSLGFIEDRLVQFEFGEELVPGITSRALVGHTPGHSGFIIRSKNETAAVLGDSVVVGFMQVEHPDWQVVFDMDPAEGVSTRFSVLEECANNGHKVFLFHANFPGIGKILKGPRGYEFQRAAYEL